MPRVRVTVSDGEDRVEQLRIAGAIRRDLWSHSPVEIDPDSPLHGTHRDGSGHAYFEFSTRFLDEVERVFRKYGHDRHARLNPYSAPFGQECTNCGNISGPTVLPICPNCGFQDIAGCPYCETRSSRQLYTRLGGDLFRCPHCERRVRLRFHDPMFAADGSYSEPLVIVDPVDAS